MNTRAGQKQVFPTPRNAVRLAQASWVALVACALSACHSPQANLVLITVDTVRSDHCSVYGYDRPTTPRLEALAREGVRFEAAYAPMATTAPSHATMFTSQYPLSHGVLKNGHALSAEHQTLAELLQRRGYETGAIVGSFVLDATFGLSQGFGSYDDEFDRQHASVDVPSWEGFSVEGGFDRRARQTTSRGLQWLSQKQAGDRPFFVWLHYFDPHAPYDPPEAVHARFRSGETSLQREIDAYDAEIAYTDAEIGRVLDWLAGVGLAEATLVVVVGDHGEGLMQHGHMEHGLHLYEEAVRVPLLMRMPGRLPAGRSIPERVGLLDLAPTVLELLETPAPASGLQGVSLLPLLRGPQRVADSRQIFLQRRAYEAGIWDEERVRGDKLAVLSGKWKYIEAPAEQSRELFDLRRDPGELTNLQAQLPEVTRELAEALAGWRRRYQREWSAQPLQPEDRAKLEALGYVQ